MAVGQDMAEDRLGRGSGADVAGLHDDYIMFILDDPVRSPTP